VGLDRGGVDEFGESLWSLYSLVPSAEDDYYLKDFERAVGREIPRELVQEVERVRMRNSQSGCPVK